MPALRDKNRGWDLDVFRAAVTSRAEFNAGLNDVFYAHCWGEFWSGMVELA